MRDQVSTVEGTLEGRSVGGGAAKVSADAPLQPIGERHGSPEASRSSTRRLLPQPLSSPQHEARCRPAAEGTESPPQHDDSPRSEPPQHDERGEAVATAYPEPRATSGVPSASICLMRATHAPHVALPCFTRFAAAIHCASENSKPLGGSTPRRSDHSSRSAVVWQLQVVQHCNADAHPQRPSAQGNCSFIEKSSQSATWRELGKTPMERAENAKASGQTSQAWGWKMRARTSPRLSRPMRQVKPTKRASRYELESARSKAGSVRLPRSEPQRDDASPVSRRDRSGSAARLRAA